MASGRHRKLRAMLGSRSSRRKGTKFQSHNQVRVKGVNATRKPGKSVWRRVRDLRDPRLWRP
jgi:hypothetical protein